MVAVHSRPVGRRYSQKEIGVTDEQKKLVEDMLKDVRGAIGANREDAKGLSKEDRKKRFEEAGKDIAEKTKKANEMAKLILEPKQLDRLEQLRLQRVGVAAFADSEVAGKLVLTQDQKDKIAKLREEARSDRGSNENLKNASKEDRKQAFDKARERGEKTQADILAFLSADQKTKWEQMQGKKFEFPQRTRGNNQ